MSKTIDLTGVAVVDTLRLARGWLAVSSASGKDDERPALDHTVCVERYREGLRLIATDTYRLLETFVPADNFTADDEPDMSELPQSIVVAIDAYGRARSLLSYMGQMAGKEENDGMTAFVRFDLPLEKPESSGFQLDGLQAKSVDIEYPDNERLQLPVYEGAFPDWRAITHHMLKPKSTTAVALSHASFAAITKASKPFGEDCRIECRFCGQNKPVAIEFGDNPRVHGLVMPVRWDFDNDAPATADE